jgi:hypothetical protein
VSAKIEVPLENDLDIIHVNCMSHFVFQTRDEKNNILFYVCPRCSLVIMVGEIHPEEQEQEQEQPEQPEQGEQGEQGEQQEVIEKHKKRRAKVNKNSDE